MISLKHLTAVLLLFTCNNVLAQQRVDSLHTKLSDADSIEILSHQDLRLRGTIEDYKSGFVDYRRRIVDSNYKTNDCIVMERKTLSSQAKGELLLIISRKYKNQLPADKAMCFEPHEAIIIYKNGKCSYIDICFDCHQFSASDDILVPSAFLSTNPNWNELKKFFMNQNIRYKIALKPR